MKQFSVFVALVLGVSFSSFGGGDKTEQLYRNYNAALRNRDNMQKYLVIRVVDVNKNEVREFCTLGCFLRHALHKEWNIDYDQLSDDLVVAKAAMNNPRLFEFKNPDALLYLGTDLYSPADLAALQKEVDFRKLAKEITAKGKWQKKFADNDKLLRMYAHALFNEGITTGEDITAEGGKLIFIP